MRPFKKAFLSFLGIAIMLLWALIFSRSDEALAQNPPDPRFGIVEAFWAPEEAADLNVGWERILFYWREIQPDGPDDWNTLHVLEEWIAQANGNGRTVVGLIKNTPSWASEDDTEAGVPTGLYLDVDDPENLWAAFVRRLVTYYSVRNVHNWIIWNEPDIPDGVYGHEFAGTMRDYYRLLKVAYLVTKEVDPEAKVHLAGITWWHDQQYLDRFLKFAAEDEDGEEHNQFFDVISLHLYFRTETIKQVIEIVDRTQKKYGFDKPIWINETNAPPNQDPDWPVDRPVFDVDLDQQSWFITQALALGFVSGAERISLYKLLDVNLADGGESFGLLRPDYSQRPAYLAFKTAISQLSGFTNVFRQQASDYFGISFLSPGKITRVFWARTPSPVTINIPAMAESALLVDVYGEELVISPEEGVYAVYLEPAECDRGCNIGGPPIYLVESIEEFDLTEVPTANAVGRQTVTPLLATVTPSRTSTPTRTPRPTSTSTTTPSPSPISSSTPTIPAPKTIEASAAPPTRELEFGEGTQELALIPGNGEDEVVKSENPEKPEKWSPTSGEAKGNRAKQRNGSAGYFAVIAFFALVVLITIALRNLVR